MKNMRAKALPRKQFLASELRISSDVLEQMIDHALQEYPLECCGLLAGDGSEIENIVPTRNQKQSSCEFFVPPAELLAFFKHLRLIGRRFMGIYHSHPHSEALPSARDLAEFHYPEVSYWVVSVKGRTPVVHSFRCSGEYFKEVEFEVMVRIRNRCGRE